jgi:hypothetical protein
MNLLDLHWIDSPLAQYSAVSFGLVTTLMLFVSLKREMSRARARSSEAANAAQGDLGDIRQDLQSLKQIVREIEDRPTSPPPAESLDLTKRGQALRMYRRGEPIPTIASALRTPQNEIQLLLKIHDLLNQ